MKLIYIVVFLCFASSFVSGQNSPLPEILVPSSHAESEARLLGADVFKLLPSGTYENPANTYIDDDNPLSLRQGGGAYYSFSNGSHSWNNATQIRLEKGGYFSVGHYGAIAYLGRYSFSEINAKTPELQYLTAYKSPKLEKEIEEESIEFHERRVNGLLFQSHSVPAVLGHTYLLRAINFEEADILVGFTVLEIAENGAVTVAWKKLADFEKPIRLTMTDSDMKAAVEKIIADNGIFKGVSVDIKDNVPTFTGEVSRKEIEIFWQAAVNKIRFRGRSYSYGLVIK